MEEKPAKLSFPARLAARLELPETALVGGFHLELEGNHELVLEGRCDLLGYTEDTVRLALRGKTLEIEGIGLQIHAMHQDGTRITGDFTDLRFL